MSRLFNESVSLPIEPTEYQCVYVCWKWKLWEMKSKQILTKTEIVNSDKWDRDLPLSSAFVSVLLRSFDGLYRAATSGSCIEARVGMVRPRCTTKPSVHGECNEPFCFLVQIKCKTFVAIRKHEQNQAQRKRDETKVKVKETKIKSISLNQS